MATRVVVKVTVWVRTVRGGYLPLVCVCVITDVQIVDSSQLLAVVLWFYRTETMERLVLVLTPKSVSQQCVYLL